jgi:CheY-specific phosphatase CheX
VNLQVDQGLLTAIINGTTKGLSMCEIVPAPVGASRLTNGRHRMSVMLGLVGGSSGSLVMNLAESAMLFLAGKMLGEDQAALSEDNIDAIMEIGNIVAGAVKDDLVETEHKVREISLPSLVLGETYSMVYARGITTVCVEFELPFFPASKLHDRYFSTTISMMRRSGG